MHRTKESGIEREEVAARFRDWIHEQPELTKCSMSADECPDWPLAFELADIALKDERPK